MGSTRRPNLMQRLCMTGTEQHAPRGAAGSGTQLGQLAVRGSHRSCTELRQLYEEAPPALGQPEPRAVHGQQELRVNALGTAGKGTLWEPLAASGPEALRDSEWSH
jgi:hypothetical protein